MNTKNFAIIQQAINDLAKENRELKERVSMFEGHIARLQAEIENSKQLSAHLIGRGMGSTVHE